MMRDDLFSFVTIEGLLKYAERLIQIKRPENVTLPSKPRHSENRFHQTQDAIPKIRAFLEKAGLGFPDAERFRAAREALIHQDCKGDELVFFAAWNFLLSKDLLSDLYRAPIGFVQKPVGERPVSIVPRNQLTPELAKDRIVIDLGDERFWLLPKHLTNRTLLFTKRHGRSQIDSQTYKVGRRLSNTLDPDIGAAKAKDLGAALARMVGVVGHQLDFLNLENYLNPGSFIHCTSNSPNTKQLFEHVVRALLPDGPFPPEALEIPILSSQDFGWATGIEKSKEVALAAEAFGVPAEAVKEFLKHPLYSPPGGHSFFDLYVEVIDGLHRFAHSNAGRVACLYTHSSTMRALITYLDPRPFHEAFAEFGSYKEGQDNVVLLTYEQGRLSGYSAAVGLSAHEQTSRANTVTLESQRQHRVTLKPGQIKQVVALVSGGDFSGAGAALKELRSAGERRGIKVHFVRHGFLGLANNWIEYFSEPQLRGMAKQASSPIGSSRFEDFKDENVQRIAVQNLSPYMDHGALVIIGGDGSLRGARALFENFGVQVVGIPGTIDNNIAGTTALGFHSAIALANHSLESLKATSAAMGSIFFVELMGAGSGHLALACAYQARAEGILVNEHPDPDAYIDTVILETLKRTLGVPNKSHLFIVAEKTPHRHHPSGGVHGLVEYVNDTVAKWPPRRLGEKDYPLAVATKATILGHTLRGAPPMPEDKTLAQDLAYETIQRLVNTPENTVGCLLKRHAEGKIVSSPLYNIQSRPFDWDVFTRMHAHMGKSHLPE